MADLEAGRSLDESRLAAPAQDTANTGGSLLQIRYEHPVILDVCAGQHGSVSHYYDI
jgi:hypothetical protein